MQKKFFYLFAFILLLGTGCQKSKEAVVQNTAVEDSNSAQNAQAELSDITKQFSVQDNKLMWKSGGKDIVVVANLKQTVEKKIPAVMKKHEESVDKLRSSERITADVGSRLAGLPQVEKLSVLQDAERVKIFFKLRVNQGLGDCDRFCWALLPTYAVVRMSDPPTVDWEVARYTEAPLPATLFEPGAVLSLSPDGRYVAFQLSSKGGQKNFWTYDLLGNDQLAAQFEFNLDEEQYRSFLNGNSSLDWSKKDNKLLIVSRMSENIPAQFCEGPLSECVNKQVKFTGTVSNLMQAHMVSPRDGYTHESYLDNPSTDQIVIYTKQPLGVSAGKKIEVIGKVIAVQGGGEPGEKLEQATAEYQILVDSWKEV